MAAAKQNRRLVLRWLAYVLLAWSLIAFGFAYHEYRQAVLEIEKDKVELQLQLDEQARLFLDAVGDVVRYTLYLSQDHTVSRLLQPGGGDEVRGLAEDRLRLLAWTDAQLLQLRVLDVTGHERLRVNQKADLIEIVDQQNLQDKAGRYYVTEGLKLAAGEVYVSPIDLNIEHGEFEVPYRSLFRTVARIDGGDGSLLGLVIINYDITALLKHYGRVVQGSPAERMMVAPNGAWQLAPNPADEWADLLGHDQRFSSRYPQVWQQMQGQQTGLVWGRDGLFGFRVLDLQRHSPFALRGDRNMSILITYLPGLSPSWLLWRSSWHHRDLLLVLLIASALLCLPLASLRHEVLRRRLERMEHLERLHLSGVLFDNTSEALVVTDDQMKIITVNPATCRMTGFGKDEILGGRPDIWKSGEHDQVFYEAMWRSLNRTGQWQGEIRNRRKNGELFTAWENISVVKDAEGKVSHYVAVMTDISGVKDAEAQLEYLAYSDTLTGLANRLLFSNNLNQLAEISRRDASPFAVSIMDLDNFKVINDSLGHGAGDELLKVIAERLRREARAEDTVARLGGDEFAVLLPGISAGADADHTMQRFLNVLSEPVLIAGREVRPKASVGVALFPDDGDKGNELIQAADAAMYEAKARGKHTFAFHHPEINRRAVRRMELEHALRHAVAHDELTLHYQPQVELSSGQIVGAEALLRWEHPQQGMIPAAEFIPVAEESGLINDIGHWVLAQACSQAKLWRLQGFPALRVAINLSGHQLFYGEIRDRLFQELVQNKTCMAQIELEVTETMLMQEPDMIEMLDRLRGRGVSLALDDFGTGYSSLGQLRRLPVNRLKIAREFVTRMHVDAESLAIVKTIIRLGHEMKMHVLAEAVEVQAQRELLTQIGCDEIQGFLIAPALPVRKFEALLQSAGPVVDWAGFKDQTGA